MTALGPLTLGPLISSMRALRLGLVCNQQGCYSPAVFVRHISTDRFRIPGKYLCAACVRQWDPPLPVDMRIERVLLIDPGTVEHITLEAAFDSLTRPARDGGEQRE